MLKNFFKIPDTISPTEYDLICRRIETRIAWLIGDIVISQGISKEHATKRLNHLLSDLHRLKDGETLYTMGDNLKICKVDGLVVISS